MRWSQRMAKRESVHTTELRKEAKPHLKKESTIRAICFGSTKPHLATF